LCIEDRARQTVIVILDSDHIDAGAWLREPIF
jgi:hypothetical protein